MNVSLPKEAAFAAPLLLAVVTFDYSMLAQPAETLSLGRAIENAEQRYPAIRVSQEQMNSAAAGIRLARTAYLPRVDLIAQANRATRNNVFGLVLPQSTLPSISGPVIGTNNLGTVWGSAVGTLVTWEPFDFGLRAAGTAAAISTRSQAEAAVKRTQFDIAAATADAYMTLIAAQETVRASQAGVQRAEVLSRSIEAQVNAQLRPGADASRVQAEVAAARTQLIQAQQAFEVARANLSQFVGLEPAQLALSAGKLLQLPQEQTPEPLNTSTNPLTVEQNAVVEQTKAQLKILERSYFPRFYLQGAAYARGSGAEVDGGRLGGLNGLAPNTQNYALGVTVTFPLFDLAAIHAKEAAQSATLRAEVARSQQIATDLKARWNAAVAALNGAKGVAANTPTQVSAARAATDQATARYQSGLGNIDAVAEAQRLLTQAEIDDALARLGVWRALLGIATAAGDLQPLVAEVGQ